MPTPLPSPASASSPRIYALPSGFASDPAACEPWLAHAAALGFDHVLLCGEPGSELAAWVKACGRRRLALLLDFNAERLCADPALEHAHPEWFEHGEDLDLLPDPRRPPAQPQAGARLRQTREVEEAVAAHLCERLTQWHKVGVAGFRCLGLAQLSPAAWQSLREAVPQARLLAWTPGCTPEQIAALAAAGFDGSFSSLAWWDLRARWFAEEYSRLATLAPPLAFPDSPDESIIARVPGYDDPAMRERICLRALALAAGAGNGWLVPLGFEFGLTGARRPGTSPEAVKAGAPFDLCAAVRGFNELVAELTGRFGGGGLRQLAGGEASASVLLRTPAPGSGDEGLLLVVNPDALVPRGASERALLEYADGLVPAQSLWPADGTEVGAGALVLEPAAIRLFLARRPPAITVPTARTKTALAAAMRAPRIAIEAISPTVDGGRFAVKRVVGDVVDIEADIFMDGHEKLAAVLLWRPADEAQWNEVRMHPLGNDRWRARLPLTRLGRYLFAIEAWRDVFATYRDELEKKAGAGLNVALELEEGRLLVEAAAAHANECELEEAKTLATLSKSLKVPGRDKTKASERDGERIAALLSEPVAEAMRRADARPFAVRSETMRIEAERRAARFSSWYELFPRSQSGDPKRHGTFIDVIGRLPAIQAMGFDTLYFPPIHPIGQKHRKGRNNSLTAGPDDPGSPYAIGSEEGGHDAIHPQLGTIEDFRRLRDEAARHGLELALDFAIQCSPDHPWLREHPEWFDWRPDGSIRYAENPPKKYQDIVNVDFYAEGAIPSLWCALRDVIVFWVKEGVRVFRVDNPHTKTLPFWEWMIADVRSRYPDTIFLSEAFTRPKMMYRLAKIGFSQSYTYFTWRHTKEEFTDYLTELTQTPVREYFRPHFFVNTPDINPPFLQKSGRPGFLIRAALATTLSGLWGMYSGFELCEGTPVPGKEEYLDSEKYEIRAWDWNRPGNIIGEISQLNRLRRENPALQSHLGIRFLPCSSDQILYFLKTTAPVSDEQALGDNVVLVAIVLDPAHAHEADIELPLWLLGLPDEAGLEAVDLLSGARVAWHGRVQHIRLDPFDNPYALWRIRHHGA